MVRLAGYGDFVTQESLPRTLCRNGAGQVKTDGQGFPLVKRMIFSTVQH